jgi:hypothetical protein
MFKNFITAQFFWKYSILLVLGFILFTVVGTLSHEAGHYLIAKKYYKNPSLHYGSVRYGEWKEYDRFQKWFVKHRESDNTIASEHKETFQKFKNRLTKQRFFATLGGPVQTILFGTIGFVALLFSAKRRFAIKDWLLVFLTFFWARELYILIALTVKWFLTGKISQSADEVIIAKYLELQPLSVTLILGIIATIIILYTLFKIIPLQYRLTFLCSGLVGSLLGFWFWLKLLGPIIMP